MIRNNKFTSQIQTLQLKSRVKSKFHLENIELQYTLTRLLKAIFFTNHSCIRLNRDIDILVLLNNSKLQISSKTETKIKYARALQIFHF